MQQILLTVILLARLAQMRSARHDLDTLTTDDTKVMYSVASINVIGVIRFAKKYIICARSTNVRSIFSSNLALILRYHDEVRK